MPSLYKEFKDGHFIVNTRGNTFSKIAMDQTQEHNNKKVKSNSGYINLVNNEDKTFLQKIKFCCPEINQYLLNAESAPETQGYKEKSSSFIKSFKKDCVKVYDKFLTFPSSVVQDSKKVFSVGVQQYKDFCLTRFILGTHDIIESKITKNLHLLTKRVRDFQRSQRQQQSGAQT